jgi:hypothetical protein
MHKGQGSTILLLGFFAILFRDIFPGSSPVWFLDLVGIFVTFPLYLFQMLVAFNWASNSQKLHIKSLYVIGMIMGLMDSTARNICIDV